MSSNDSEYSRYIDGLYVLVSKDGGGTLGKSYEGSWTVSVQNGPVWVLDNATLTTGTPKTHRQVAYLAYDYAQAEI